MTREEIQNEALSKVISLNRAGLGLSVGAGKTLVGLKWLKFHLKNDSKFLIVVPKLNLIQSWKDEAQKFNLLYIMDYCEFVTYLSLHKCSMDRSAIILEEAHSLKYSHEGWLDAQKGPILGLTGTPPTHDFSEKGKMINKFCPIVYTYITDDAVDDKILNDYKIYLHYIDLSTVKNIENKMKNGKVFYTSEQSSYDYWTNRLAQAYGKELEICRLMRMKALQKFKSKETYVQALTKVIKNKCIIFANEKLQADRLCRDSYHSGNPKSEFNLSRFEKGEITLMSSVEQLSEGKNIPGLKELIVMHGFSNPRKFKQRFGRAMRLTVDDEAIVHLLVYRNTCDEQWCESALSSFNENKIIKLDPKIKSYGS